MFLGLNHVNAITVSASSGSGQDFSFIVCPNLDIMAGNSFLQETDFNSSNLSGSTIVAGSTSFQGAVFDNAILTSVNFSGGIAAFQSSSFINADLTGATLSGGSGAFQIWRIDGANFSGADISSISTDNLVGGESFLDSFSLSAAPTYTDATIFPNGFDPVAAGWSLVPEPTTSLMVLMSLGGLIGYRKKAGK